jgi:hypothetical protein
MRPKLSLEERFWRHVRMQESSRRCWPWQGQKKMVSGRIYGLFMVDDKSAFVQHIAYVLTFGPIRRTERVAPCAIDRLCCNPKHLSKIAVNEWAARG